MQVRRLIQGTAPLLISIPHAGMFLPPDIKQRLTDVGRKMPDTDFYVDQLYDFAKDLGASILSATHSRYVIDLNRAEEDTDLYPGQVKTGLCPIQTFDGMDIYQNDETPDHIEIMNRITAYWQPYHATLATELENIKSKCGYAMLYDAHSIVSTMPRLFEGVLPDLNIGTAHGKTCATSLSTAMMDVATQSSYTSVLNGRFVGGFITRHYGDPENDIHAVQMEIACKNYMSEKGDFKWDAPKAEALKITLKDILNEMLKWGKVHYPSNDT